MKEYTVLCPFSGLGAGALGFKMAAPPKLFGEEARFRLLGGIDIDPDACADFEYLTGAPALCADIAKLTPADLRAFAGIVPPDVVFTSAPCKGSSGLLPEAKAKTEPYQALNRLALDWAELMVSTWDTPPKLLLFENVPRINKRASGMLRELKAILKKAGYLIHEGNHECGELGGLAQMRKRYLMVARQPDRCPPLLYQPPKKRVRACGEVLGELPMPNDPAAGPMHELPAIGWKNWVRLAMIPAGGDWRDIPGVLAEGQKRRELFKRHAVEKWGAPTGTVGGPGSNGVENVADPRVTDSRVDLTDNPDRHWNKYAVGEWDQPSRTVMGATRPGSGAPSVADPRRPEWFRGTLGVVPWTEPSGTVTGAAAASRGPFSVADPRVHGVTRAGHYGIASWSEPSKTVTGSANVDNSPVSVADPRVGNAYDHGYAVRPWGEPSFTVAGGSHPGQGAYSVADPRSRGVQHYLGGTIGLDDAEQTVGENPEMPLPVAIVDEGGQVRMVVRSYTGRLDGIPVIVAKDGTWHRPMTTLELAVLQGLPAFVNGAPLLLSGTSTSGWRERIGNAVPVQAAQAIAEQMLVTLMSADAGSFSLSSDGGAWVTPEMEAALQ